MRGIPFGIVLIVAIALALIPDPAWACEHCYGNAGDNETTRGIAMAMGALLGMTSVVGVGVLAFFRRLAKRAKMLEAGDLVVNECGELVEIVD